jgi:hypothetical protein
MTLFPLDSFCHDPRGPELSGTCICLTTADSAVLYDSSDLSRVETYVKSLVILNLVTVVATVLSLHNGSSGVALTHALMPSSSLRLGK